MDKIKKNKWPEKADFPVAKPGFKYVGVVLALTVLFFLLGWKIAGILSLGVTLYVCWFFRDPDRIPPGDQNAFISPADGVVVKAQREESNPYVDGSCIMVSVFMNIFNVHVNRVPMSGRVEESRYFPGKFINASFDKASEDNERNALVLSTEEGQKYAVVQIAGLVARRIVCKVEKGDLLERGHRYGMICFGSRLDLYLPLETRIEVSLGEKVQAGSSIIGIMKPKV